MRPRSSSAPPRPSPPALTHSTPYSSTVLTLPPLLLTVLSLLLSLPLLSQFSVSLCVFLAATHGEEVSARKCRQCATTGARPISTCSTGDDSTGQQRGNVRAGFRRGDSDTAQAPGQGKSALGLQCTTPLRSSAAAARSAIYKYCEAQPVAGSLRLFLGALDPIGL